MREDMDKVIVERPRWAHALGHHALRGGHRPRDLEDAPRSESMRAAGRDKHLNENLAPLVRFLAKRVGRPWNEVYSEICEQLSPRTAVQKHVRDHLDDYVARSVVLIDGAPHEPEARGSERTDHAPIRSTAHRPRFYVHPESATLERAPFAGVRRAAASDPDVVAVDRSLEYRRVDGVWYEVRFENAPGYLDRRTIYDALLRERLEADQWGQWSQRLGRRYGYPLRYAVSRRQLGSREVARVVETARARQGR